MSDLEPTPPDLHALLSALPVPVARAPDASARVLARIEHTLVVAPPPASGGSASVAASTAGTSVLGAKVIVPLLLAGAIPAGVAGYFAGRASVVPLPAEVRIVEVPVRAQPAPELPTEPAVEPSPVPVKEATGKPRPVPTPEPLLADDGRPLVEAARTALLKSDAKTALELLGQHAKKYPASQLAEERSALEIQALLLAGDTGKARTAALAFKAKWKNSVFSAVADAALSDGG